jgi:hypothetical protein
MRISSGCAAAGCEYAITGALVIPINIPIIIPIIMASADAKRLSFILIGFPWAVVSALCGPAAPDRI